MAARRRPGLSLLGGCMGWGSFMGQPCYPCAALVWSLHLNIVRMCRRRPDDADRSADASKKTASLCGVWPCEPVYGFLSARETRGRERSQIPITDASPRAPPP